nr:hypothetical protein [Tanacetum cinerariifolium]
VPTGKPKVKPVPTGKPKVTPVPTGKPQVSTPVPTSRPNKPFPVPTDRGYSPSENPFSATEDERIFNSGCSRSMTGRNIGKGIIRTPTLDFKNVYYVKELQQFNLFSISRICDKKKQVLFTDTECLVLSKDFKLSDDMAHASFDESVKWHRRMAHVNYKNMNSYFKPFGGHVTILSISDHLGKFYGKADEGYIGLGHEWYFDLDYLTDSLGYTHVQANQSAGTQGATTNSAGIQADDSDSDCDEQVIIVPSYPSHSIQGTQPIDSPGEKVDDSSFHIPVPAAAIMVPSDDVPVHTCSSTDSMFDGEPITRFLCPSDLGNHDPSPGIFSSLSYDDEFDTALNNVASSVVVSPMATKRINTIHPQSLIIGDPTYVVQTRSKAKPDT